MQSKEDLHPRTVEQQNHRQLLQQLKKSVELWFLIRRDDDTIENLDSRDNCMQILLSVDSILTNDIKQNAGDFAQSHEYASFLNDLDWLKEEVYCSSGNDSKKGIKESGQFPKLEIEDHLLSWVYKNLLNNDLCDKLKLLASDEELLSCYYRASAFMRKEQYATALLICLSAIELNQSSLLSQVDNTLFGQILSVAPTHKRSSSHPHFSISVTKPEKSLHDGVDGHRINMKPAHSQKRKTRQPTISKDKLYSLRRSKSLPNISSVASYFRTRSQTISQPISIPLTNNQSPHHHEFYRNYERQNSEPNPSFDYMTSSSLCGESSSSGAGSSGCTRKNCPSESVQSSGSTPPITLVKCEDIKIYEDHRHSSQGYNDSIYPPTISPSLKTIDYDSPPSPKASPLNFLSCIATNVFSPSSDGTGNLSSSPPYLKFSSSVPADFVSSFLTREGEKLQSRKSKSIFDDLVESRQAQHGIYINRIPSVGQSLTEFLQAAQFSKNNTDLERENDHFNVSEAIICAIEQMKWTKMERRKKRNERKLSKASNTSTTDDLKRTKCKILKVWNAAGEDHQKPLDSNYSSCSDFDDLEGAEISPDDVDSDVTDSDEDCSDFLKKLAVSTQNISDHTAYAEWGASNSEALSAEGVALSLISKFSDKQLPRASEIPWLVSEEDAPQQLLPMPGSPSDNPDDNIVHSVTRGTRDWAPPRPQIIFTPHPPPNRKMQILKQNNRCAGCGMRVSQNYINRFRYCNYLGKYMCTGCHRNQISSIPAKVLEGWDFTLYPVSLFSYRLLEQIWTYPLFHVPDLNPHLYERIKNLYLARKKRIQLKYINDFISMCRFSEDEKKLFHAIPSHLTDDLDKWSMNDFVAAKERTMLRDLQFVVEQCESHVFNCVLCTAHGFICELCPKVEKDVIIYPWQDRISRCDDCGSCYHTKCWRQRSDFCQKCQRLKRRKDQVLNS